MEYVEIDPGKIGCTEWILCNTGCHEFYFGVNHGQKSKGVLWTIANGGELVGPGQARIVGPGIFQFHYIDADMGQIYTEGVDRLGILLTDEDDQGHTGF
jgi:hypothetical protein